MTIHQDSRSSVSHIMSVSLPQNLTKPIRRYPCFFQALSFHTKLGQFRRQQKMFSEIRPLPSL